MGFRGWLWTAVPPACLAAVGLAVWAVLPRDAGMSRGGGPERDPRAVKVLCAEALRGPVAETIERFQRRSGVRVVAEYGSVAALEAVFPVSAGNDLLVTFRAEPEAMAWGRGAIETVKGAWMVSPREGSEPLRLTVAFPSSGPGASRSRELAAFLCGPVGLDRFHAHGWTLADTAGPASE